MPFKSKKQARKAFATGGFGGKIDPKEWADKTDFKRLPESKRRGKSKRGELCQGRCASLTGS